jgi:hypothetical protein
MPPLTPGKHQQRERHVPVRWSALLGHNDQMKIKEITFEMGNDFAAVMECEHCQSTQKLSSGYHDNFYHTRVIPAMTCKSCGKNRDGVVSETANTNGTLSVA